MVDIPASFLGDSVTKTDHPVIVHGQRVDWKSPEGALTLSHDAQKLALAREVVCLESSTAALQTLLVPDCLAGTWTLSISAKHALGLYGGPINLRVAFNLVAAVVGFVAYAFSTDSLTHALEAWLDRAQLPCLQPIPRVEWSSMRRFCLATWPCAISWVYPERTVYAQWEHRSQTLVPQQTLTLHGLSGFHAADVEGGSQPRPLLRGSSHGQFQLMQAQPCH
uniref:Transmembrane protein 177 n=1 Tax=Pipistrellus kuhlii TaxID=59472 RepID=A0A7J8B5Q8_PIPKU|nr:hypothetical protein mPipKuh1_017592 [Pipistrellus kuhlii]